MAGRANDKIFQLDSLARYILLDSQTKTWELCVDVFEIRKLVSSLCHIFMKQRVHKTLSKRQSILAEKFEALQKVMKEANVIKKTTYSADVFPLWTILKQRLDLQNDGGMQEYLRLY